jgi:5-methylcytosine-specific restriction endonuclease McrA
MRKVRRLPLDSDTTRKLKQKQDEADSKSISEGFDRAAYWKSARTTKPLLSVLSTLKTMAGARERCMYCVDSRGTDIEHFWPQSTYPQRIFLWSNHLLCCTDCGRIKGDRFPLVDGVPLMVDPTVDEPWNYIDFDPDTGNLIPLYDVYIGDYSPRGTATVEILKLDKREALATGHMKSLRRLSAHVTTFLGYGLEAGRDLVEVLLDDDEYGLLAWCVIGNGWKTAPFRSLRQNHPAIWEALENAIRRI